MTVIKGTEMTDAKNEATETVYIDGDDGYHEFALLELPSSDPDWIVWIAKLRAILPDGEIDWVTAVDMYKCWSPEDAALVMIDYQEPEQVAELEALKV